jgi:hypothetical protein
LSPEERLLSRVPVVLQAAPLWRGLAQRYQCIGTAKLFEGMEPGKDGASLPLRKS